MEIKTLDKLLKEKNRSGARAIIGSDGKVWVYFSNDSKCYKYAGNIYNVAEKLDLIPEFDIPVEAKKIVAALKAGKEFTSCAGALDTVRQSLRYATKDDCGVDEYDRRIAT